MNQKLDDGGKIKSDFRVTDWGAFFPEILAGRAADAS